MKYFLFLYLEAKIKSKIDFQFNSDFNIELKTIFISI